MWKSHNTSLRIQPLSPPNQNSGVRFIEYQSKPRLSGRHHDNNPSRTASYNFDFIKGQHSISVCKIGNILTATTHHFTPQPPPHPLRRNRTLHHNTPSPPPHKNKLLAHPPTLPHTRPTNTIVPRNQLPRPPTPRYNQHGRSDRSSGQTHLQATPSWNPLTSFPPEKPLFARPDIVDQLAAARAIIDILAMLWDDARVHKVVMEDLCVGGRFPGEMDCVYREFIPIPTHDGH